MTVQHGVTLVELLVVLALLGILSGVVGLTLRSAQPPATADPVRAAVALARDSSIRSGHAVSIVLATDSQPYDVTALPDGRIIGDKRLATDTLTGQDDATP